MDGKQFAKAALNSLTSSNPVTWAQPLDGPGERLLAMRNFSFWPALAFRNDSRPTALLLAAALLFGFACTTPAKAVTRATVTRHGRKSSRAFRAFRLAKWNPVFAGSHDLLVHQNVELDRLQLPRIANDVELMNYELSLDLVPVSESDALKIAADLPDNRRYCRPWTRDFLEDFSRAFYAEFGTPIQVNSLVRTAEQQKKLRRHNRFAAPELGDTASTHLTGVTADLSRRGLTKAQYKWIRDYLMPLREAGLVEPIEERQPVLHIVVYDRYSARDDNPVKLSGTSDLDNFSLAASSGISAR